MILTMIMITKTISMAMLFPMAMLFQMTMLVTTVFPMTLRWRWLFRWRWFSDYAFSQDPVHLLDEIPSSEFIECNHTRAIDFFSRHPRDESSGGDAFRHLARKTIVTAAKILDGLGIRFWISSGRNGIFSPHFVSFRSLSTPSLMFVSPLLALRLLLSIPFVPFR